MSDFDRVAPEAAPDTGPTDAYPPAWVGLLLDGIATALRPATDPDHGGTDDQATAEELTEPLFADPRSVQRSGDPTDSRTLGPQQRDLLPLGEEQVPARGRTQLDQRHPATLAEPPRTNCARHADLDRRDLAAQPRATCSQNARSTSRRTDGRPGDRSAGRPVCATIHPAPRPTTHLHARGVATTG